MTEHELQSQCVTWFRDTYKSIANLLISVPNGVYFGAGKQKAFAYMKKLKDEGLTNGVSDLILLKSNGKYSNLGIEMKVGYNKQSKEQKEWQVLNETNGNKYVVVYTEEEFKKVITEYINGEN